MKLKKAISILLAVCTIGASGFSALTANAEQAVNYDINLDGAFDINDATYVQMYLAGYFNLTDGQYITADVNNDGIVDINDVTAIQMILAGYPNRYAYDPEALVTGDIDNDGLINDNDVEHLADYIYGDYKPIYKSEDFITVADINSDGNIDKDDIVTLAEMLRNRKLGDINCNGVIDEPDCELLEAYVKRTLDAESGWVPVQSYLNADVNQDNVIDINDATAIQFYLANGGPEFQYSDEQYSEDIIARDAELRENGTSNISTFETARNFDLSNYMLTTLDSSGVTFKDHNWEYGMSTNGSGITLLSYCGASKTAIVPGFLDGKTVTLVDPDYLTDETGIETLIIPSEANNITFRDRCFTTLTSLKTLIIEEGITSEQFNSQVFINTPVKYVSWPTTMTTVPYGIFKQCTNISSLDQLHLPDTVTSIEDYAFAYTNLSSTVTIPENITKIGNFEGCIFEGTSVRSATVLNRNAQIVTGAFSVWTGSDSSTFDTFTIYGYTGSTAEAFVRTFQEECDAWIELGFDAVNPYVFKAI